MRTTHVESFRVPLPGARPPFVRRKGLLGPAPDGEASVPRTGPDSGATGVALAARSGTASAADDTVDRVPRTEPIGRDPLQREPLWHRLWEPDRVEELPLLLLGLVDTELCDLAARIGDQPVWQLPGGLHDKIPAYEGVEPAEPVETAEVGEMAEVGETAETVDTNV